MIPTHFYNGGEHGERFGDAEWLVETIDKLPIRKQKPVSQRYSEIYQELALSDPDKCRFRSNSWLRKTVEKICKEFEKNNDNTLPF